MCSFITSSVPIGVPGATSGSMFTPIPVEITANDPEVTGLDLLHKTKFAKMRQVEPIPDLARISEGTGKLEHMLDAVISYVEDVLSGREKPNNAVGRKLLDLVYSVPKMTPDEKKIDLVNSGIYAFTCQTLINNIQMLIKQDQHFSTTSTS